MAYTIPQYEKDIELIKYIPEEFNAKEVERTDDGGFKFKGAYNPKIDGIILYPKGLTGAERDVVKGNIFETINKKHADYMEYGATDLVSAVKEISKAKAKNEIQKYIKQKQQQEQEPQQAEQEPTDKWIQVTTHGNKTVNVGFLYEHIEETVVYKLVRKKGSETFFLYIYNEDKGVYEQASKADMVSIINEHVPIEIRKPSIANQVYEMLIYSNKHVRNIEDFNTNQEIINFTNGIYNVKEDKMYKHSPEYLSSIQVQCDYSKELADKCNKGIFDSYMNNLYDTEEERELLLEVAGLALSNIDGSKTKKALHQSGAGDTGKTRFRAFISNILGKEHICTTELDKLGSNPHATFSLYNKRIYGSCDISYAKAGSIDIYKQLTGGDDIEANPKGRDAFSFKFTGVIWTIGNKEIIFGGDKGDHVYKRILYLHSENVVTNIDPYFDDKLMAEKEYIVYKCMQALKTLLARGLKFEETPKMLELRRAHMIMNNNFLSFIFDNFEITNNELDYVVKSEFNAMYDAYVKENGGYKVAGKDREMYIEQLKGDYPNLRIRQRKSNNINLGYCVIGLKKKNGINSVDVDYSITTDTYKAKR